MIHEDYIKAGAPAATSETLRGFSYSEIPAVRRRVAENPKTPAPILALLAKDPDPEVRIAVGSNRATPGKVIKQLLRDDSADVRYALDSYQCLCMACYAPIVGIEIYNG